VLAIKEIIRVFDFQAGFANKFGPERGSNGNLARLSCKGAPLETAYLEHLARRAFGESHIQDNTAL
jgi:hypothetical protein